MSLFTDYIRPVLQQKASEITGVPLPQKQPKVVKLPASTATTAKQKTVTFIEKYQVALALTAVLGVLVLIKLRA